MQIDHSVLATQTLQNIIASYRIITQLVGGRAKIPDADEYVWKVMFQMK